MEVTRSTRPNRAAWPGRTCSVRKTALLQCPGAPIQNTRVRFHVLLISCLATAVSSAQEPRDLIDQFGADAQLLERHWEITGDSQAAMARERAMLQGWLKKLGGVPFASLSRTGQVDYVLLRNELEASLARLHERETEAAALEHLLPFRNLLDPLTEARVRGLPLNPEKAANALAPLAKAVTDLQGKLKALKEKKPAAAAGAKDGQPALTLPEAHQALLASERVELLAGSLKRWHDNYQGYLPDFSWWVKQPYDDAAKALEGYARFLREEIAGVKDKDNAPLLGKAIGASELQAQLAYEFIPYTPEELVKIAEAEFTWCEEQMKKAAQDMNLADDWKKALLRVKLQYVRPGEQESFVREEGRRATEFVKKNNLVTVPPDCEEWWGTRMLSPQEQRQIPYAAYSGHDVLVAYANEAMKHEDKMMSMRGNNRPFMRNVVPHELIPGHHLQNFMAARHLPYRRAFSTPFYVEGWALYWEMRLWDLGYQTTPEDRIGALFWRMHRCARIVVTLKFHLGQMKPDEMVKFLTDRVGHETFGATSEVRRFIKGDYAPLYQCGYMLGGLQLIALHKETVAAGKMSEKEFHDSLLKLGPIPVELVRASLLGLPLEPGTRTTWKFGTRAGL